MKIIVVSKTGTEQTLNLTGSWRVIEGQEYSRLVGPGGTSYFFTADGEYDGWGTKLFRAPERAGDLASEQRYRIFPERAHH